MSQQQSRDHHIVPQFYLRRFAAEGRIVAIEIKTGRMLENQNIEEVAFEKHGNRPAGVLIDQRMDVESEIAIAESRFARALREFPHPFPSSREIRETVSDFILFQIVRDPRKREQYEGRSLKDHQLLALGLLMNDPNNPEQRRLLDESGLLEPREEVRADVSERSWHLYETRAGGTAEFITSDSPVYLADWEQHGLRQHADVHQMFLPLDRYHLLMLERGSPEDDRVVEASVSQVLELNRRTAHAARRFAYAHPAINRRWLRSSVQPAATASRRDRSSR